MFHRRIRRAMRSLRTTSDEMRNLAADARISIQKLNTVLDNLVPVEQAAAGALKEAELLQKKLRTQGILRLLFSDP
ncbi:MAG TPA: hypothetical protein HA257_09230 [Candidatus Methanoperedenaceae archaeon]|nr:hypothetical protein [Candidatus Methanoperedenaceae archaeon]